MLSPIPENRYLHGSTGPVLNSGRILVQLVPQPPTALGVSVCTHTAQKPVAPPRLPLCLGRGSRENVISVLWLGVPALSRSYLRSSYTWGTRVVPFALTFNLYAWSSIVSLVLTLQLLLGYKRFLARNHAEQIFSVSGASRAFLSSKLCIRSSSSTLLFFYFFSEQ